MGDRVNIKIKYSEGADIYFYSHWEGYRISNIVADALDRGRDRWTSEAYLARIIFSEMIKNGVLEETGFGIAPYEIDDQNPTITVNIPEQMVSVEKTKFSFEDWIKRHLSKGATR